VVLFALLPHLPLWSNAFIHESLADISTFIDVTVAQDRDLRRPADAKAIPLEAVSFEAVPSTPRFSPDVCGKCVAEFESSHND
jgi:hypothetical protein